MRTLIRDLFKTRLFLDKTGFVWSLLLFVLFKTCYITKHLFAELSGNQYALSMFHRHHRNMYSLGITKHSVSLGLSK